ncbi:MULTISPECIES: SDR family NAD(P)-dependent oxidoreductase [Pseudonocardia]|uniref:3-alpha-(Or 20-beta)-hydroxysteroid dehydrogenase n=2 Tax=Pseudonocardia TaxID=1847 RepID=A0A1Y2N9T6_PSEAH|nr:MULTISPECIES: SDR family oxidoreductase [Pseudonocardia]OSY44224.1 3-alpha-(or 20-beta)-hydroxysteroid dehydrogenase [Pseudonocardia autotrophica]TDN74046.1 NAD(P)-dependent dehydrogenase (short-subunit alcohol dehydrogenase family) [Pseudonocardia autotrophica]
MSGRMDGRVALVTGGAYGIGAAIAARFAAEGAEVVVADIDGAEAAEGDGVACRLRCDVSVADDVAAAVAVAEDRFGGLDIMVNNAGLGSACDLVDLDDEQWARVIGVSLTGTFHGIRHAAPAIARRGGGAILNVSSLAAGRALPGMGAYSAAKAGVEALTRTAAVELRGSGIRVNAVVPGLIRTAAARAGGAALARGLGVDDLQDYLDQRQGRWGEPEEVAEVAVHLAGDGASFTSGLLYTIDNGGSAS